MSQVLAHTAMVVGAMTRHGDVVMWCMEHTSARPWVVTRTLVCVVGKCCGKGFFTLCHRCADPSHNGQETAPLLELCAVGDLDVLQQLMRDHSECRDGVRDGSTRDEVEGARGCRLLWY